MLKLTMTALSLVAMTGFAFAQDPAKNDKTDLPAKVMDDAPGVNDAGTTADPTAKPGSGVSKKVMKDAPGTTGGSTDTPTAEPKTGSLTDADKNQ